MFFKKKKQNKWIHIKTEQTYLTEHKIKYYNSNIKLNKEFLEVIAKLPRNWVF